MPLNFRRFINGLKITPKSSSTANERGEFDVSYVSRTFSTTDVATNPTNTITIISHGFSNGDVVNFSSSDTLPAPLVITTNYYVISATTNTFQVSLTSGGLVVPLTSVGSGTHTVIQNGKLNYHNGTSASAIVTEQHKATLTQKTLTSPVLNTSTADTITGISGNITVTGSTSTNLTATGAGVVNISSVNGKVNISSSSNDVQVENINFSGTAISSVPSGGIVFLQNFAISNNNVTNTGAINILPASGTNLKLSTTSTGIVKLGDSAEASTKIDADSNLAVNKLFSLTRSNNSQTGSSVTITGITSSYTTLTGSGLVSIAGINATGAPDGQFIVLTNSTGSNVTILNNDAGATANDRIITGTAGNVILSDSGSISLIYNTVASRWQIVSIVQASSIPTPSITTISTSTTLTNSNDYVLVNGTGITVNLPTTLIGGKTFNIKKIFNDSVPVVIQCATATIDGISSISIIDQYDSFTITTDGVNYFII